MTQVSPPSAKSTKSKAAAISPPQGSTNMSVLDKNNGVGGVINTEKVTGIVKNGDSNNSTNIKSEPKSSTGNRTPLCVPQMAASIPLSDDDNSPAPSLPPFNNSNDPTGHYEQAWNKIRSKRTSTSTKVKATASTKIKVPASKNDIAPTKRTVYNSERMKAPWADGEPVMRGSTGLHNTSPGPQYSPENPDLRPQLNGMEPPSKYPSIRNKNIFSQQPDDSPYGGTEFEEDWQYVQSSDHGQYPESYRTSHNGYSMAAPDNRYAHEGYDNGGYGASSNLTLDPINNGRSTRNGEPSYRRASTIGSRGASSNNHDRDGSSVLVDSEDEDSRRDVDYTPVNGPRKRSHAQASVQPQGRSKTSHPRSRKSGKQPCVGTEDEDQEVDGSSKYPPFHPFSQDTYVHALDESAGPELMGPPLRRSRTQDPLGEFQDGGSQRSSMYEEEEEEEAPEVFNDPGRNLKPSRYSGAEMAWGTNTLPALVNQEDVSDASLLKRGLKRGQADKVCKRGYGANDPENVKIVNLRESGLTFEKIKNQLNAQRIKLGRDPSLTVCGITARYNRTAPLLFAARGEEFVPLSQRKRGAASNASGRRRKFQWTDDYDLALVNCYKDIEAKKWIEIAALFRELTGEDVDEETVAVRHTML